MTISNDLTWKHHVKNICKKASQRLFLLCLLKRAGVTPKDLIQVFKTLIRPLVEYACELWHCGLTMEQSGQIESIQKRALRITFPDVAYLEALQTAGLETLENRRGKLSQNLFMNLLDHKHKLHHLLPKQRTVNYNLRICKKYPVPKIHCKRTLRSPIVYGLSYFQ